MAGSLTQGERGVSVLLYGLPGTGKTEFSKMLAARMGTELYALGEADEYGDTPNPTERLASIRMAQSLLRHHGDAALLIDEADSFLQDRRGARRSWEVTGVNEMLTWMESHPLPFACTTNLMDAVDPAAMRRFTFKLRFEHLDPPRVRAAFERFFGAEWPKVVPLPAQLAPGDYAVVKQRARIEGVDDPVRLARMLAEECRHKPQRARGMGFLQSGS